jgi:hypothetical protein
MIKVFIHKFIGRYGVWRSIQILLILCTMLLAAPIGIQLFVPVKMCETDNNLTPDSTADANISAPPANKSINKSIAFHSGLFNAATGLQDKPLADKTIERIKDQLKLQCVVEIKGKPVAYIAVKEVGLKKCGVGDSVNDLFTVLDINKQNKTVDISIVDHKISLHL